MPPVGEADILIDRPGVDGYTATRFEKDNVRVHSASYCGGIARNHRIRRIIFRFPLCHFASQEGHHGVAIVHWILDTFRASVSFQVCAVSGRPRSEFFVRARAGTGLPTHRNAER
jgi:hypothetical protein